MFCTGRLHPDVQSHHIPTFTEMYLKKKPFIYLTDNNYVTDRKMSPTLLVRQQDYNSHYSVDNNFILFL